MARNGPPHGRQPLPVELRLLGGLELVVGDRSIELAPAGQLLLAFLAVRRRSALRSVVAGTLWLDCSDQRAALSKSFSSFSCCSAVPSHVVPFQLPLPFTPSTP